MLSYSQKIATSRFPMVLILTVLTAKVLLLVLLAWNSRFVMDEFWHISQSNYLFNGFFETIFPEKAVGYAVFYKLAHIVGHDSAQMMIVGRFLSVSLAICLVATVYAIARSLHLSEAEALLCALLLLSFSNFMERSFEIRSEPLAILFSALALLIVMRGTADSSRKLFLAGVLCGLSFVSTQKSVYFNVALGAGLVLDAFLTGRPSAILRRVSLLILGWMAVVAVYSAAFGGLNPSPVLTALFFGPLEVASSAQDYYGNLRSFVVQTLVRNAPLYLLALYGVLATLTRLRSDTPQQRIHVIFTTIIALLVFFHNQPWPYVFTMALPFLAPYTVLALRIISNRMSMPLVIPILLAGVLTISFQRNLLYLEQSNVEQLAMIRDAERLLPDGGTYFDGTGMLPSQKMEPYIWLDVMGISKILDLGARSKFSSSFFESPPDLIILSYRTDALLPILEAFLRSNYERVSDDLLLKRGRLSPQSRTPDVKSHRNLFEQIYTF